MFVFQSRNGFYSVYPFMCAYISTVLTRQPYSASADNISRVYNSTLGKLTTNIPNLSRLSQELSSDVVLDAFFLFSLLCDKARHHAQLKLPHNGLQQHRFDVALSQRNYRIAGTGQEMWAHACNRCMKIYKGADGNWCMFTSILALVSFTQRPLYRSHDSQSDRWCYCWSSMLLGA